MKNLPNLEFQSFDRMKINEEQKAIFVDLVYQDSIEHSKPLPPDTKEDINARYFLGDRSNVKIYNDFVKVNGKIIGYGRWYESFENQNTNRTDFFMFILEEFRNQGIAKKYLEYLLPQIPVKIDTISAEMHYEGETGFGKDRWLHNKLVEVGAKLAYTEMINGVNIKSFDINTVKMKAAELRKLAEERGFDIIFCMNGEYREKYPDQYPEFVDMRVELWNDMPIEDMTSDEETLTIEEHDEQINRLIRSGRQILNFIAREKSTGKYAGLTEVWYTENVPWKASQDDTGVLKPYRGNKLGLTLKYQMLEYLLTSELTNKVEWWITGNASVNAHMLDINNELKHTVLYRRVNYEISKEQLKQVLDL